MATIEARFTKMESPSSSATSTTSPSSLMTVPTIRQLEARWIVTRWSLNRSMMGFMGVAREEGLRGEKPQGCDRFLQTGEFWQEWVTTHRSQELPQAAQVLFGSLDEACSSKPPRLLREGRQQGVQPGLLLQLPRQGDLRRLCRSDSGSSPLCLESVERGLPFRETVLVNAEALRHRHISCGKSIFGHAEDREVSRLCVRHGSPDVSERRVAGAGLSEVAV